MISSRNHLCAIIAIINIFAYAALHAELTTLMHYDPAPIYSANNSMMPPNSQFLDLKQARFKEEQPDTKRYFGLNVSGFVQGANQANSSSGVQYGTVSGVPEQGFEMGDFRGTLYAMGLFLGANPNNGNSIWGTYPTTVNPQTTPPSDGTDNGYTTSITDCSIQATNFADCIQDAIEALSGNSPSSPCTKTSPTTGLVFNTSTTTNSSVPSVFNTDALSLDTKYFGAFSLPITYRKQGLRFELNFNFCDYAQFTFQGGFANIKQTFNNTIASTTTTNVNCNPIGQTSPGPYSISNVQTVCPTGATGTPQSVSSLYASLNLPTVSSNTPAQAQAIFNEWVSNNLFNLLSPSCGVKQTLCNFDEYSAEDLRFYLTFQCPFDPKKNYKEQDEVDFSDMMFTPYAYLGVSCPVAQCTDYTKLLSLAFGNNGHTSIGAGVGMTFDFAESVEVGFEGGGTYFFARNETRPFPTHPLQRMVFPFSTQVRTAPGSNWHFKALLNSYQFLKHVSFWFTYEVIEHRKDCFTVCNSSQSQYFFPDVLTCISDWRAQFFNAAIVFDFQPGFQASLAWQQPISPRNAYYPVGIIGSINFMF
jgi:hypothetical protein